MSNKDKKYLYELLTKEDIRIAKEDAGYVFGYGVGYNRSYYSCDRIIENLEIGDHCIYGPSTCPLFSRWTEDKELYSRQAIYVDKSYALYCPILLERLKRRYQMIKRRKFWEKKFKKTKH